MAYKIFNFAHIYRKLAHNFTTKLKYSHSLYFCMICSWPPLPETFRLPLFVPLVNSKIAIHPPPNDRLLNPSMGMTSKSYLWCPFEKSRPLALFLCRRPCTQHLCIVMFFKGYMYTKAFDKKRHSFRPSLVSYK